MSYHERAVRYAQRVIAGEIVACKLTRMACERFLKDLARTDWQWRFDEALATRACTFIEHLPHIKGQWARQRLKISLEDWQVFIVCNLFGWVDKDTGLRRFITCYLEVARKNAKALALDTHVPTPNGWSTIGELQPGDMVFGVDGRPCRVTAVSQIYTDHDCYKLRFSNEEEVVADAGHLWLTTARIDRPNGKRDGCGPSRTRVRTTLEIAETLRHGTRGDLNHSLAMPAPLDCENVELPVAPYTLGAWLGDGHSACARITCAREDAEILENIRADGWPVLEKYRTKGKASTFVLSDGDRRQSARNCSLASELRRLGVLGDKHIPAVYLRASLEKRLSLLQGLMDTDGTISKNGRVLSYSGVNERLVGGVAGLLASLGVKYSWRRGPLVCNGRSVPGAGHYLQFMAFRDELPVFRLRRKLDRMLSRSDCSMSPRSRTVQIISVELVPSVPVRCITVDSPDHLFLFGRTMLPTHNSTLAAGIALYMLAADGEPGAEVYSAATTGDQARIVFDVARQMVLREAEFIRGGIDPQRHGLYMPEDARKFEPLNAEGSTLDGLNPHCTIIDELHAHKRRDVYDVLDTARGARDQSLLASITTAGSDRAGICYEQRTYVVKVLEGVFDDERYFGVIYTLDDDDDWTDPAVWPKANPNYGVSVLEDDFERSAREAMNKPSAQNNFLTKRLNIWVNADSAWMDMRAWDRCHNPALKLDDFEGQDCIAAFDLASKVDIAARILLFKRGKKYAAFGRYYLPEQAVDDGRNSQYSGWSRLGRLVVTDGNVVDYDRIETDLKEDAGRFRLTEAPYDPFQAMQFSQRMLAEGMPMVEMRATVLNFSEPMKELEKLVLEGNFEHDGDPVLTWMVSNVVCHRDAKDNIYPRKEREENKIDGVVALIMALGRAMAGHKQEPESAVIFL